MASSLAAPRVSKKIGSEDEFWQSMSETPGGRPSDMGPIISLLVESSPEELEGILDAMFSPMARQGLTEEEFLSGVGSILTLLRWETSPSLKKRHWNTLRKLDHRRWKSTPGILVITAT